MKIIRQPLGSEKPWAVVGEHSGVIIRLFYDRGDAWEFMEFTERQRRREAQEANSKDGLR